MNIDGVRTGQKTPISPIPSASGRGRRLQDSYAVIGRALLLYEVAVTRYPLSAPGAQKSFREEVTFVSREVLESYLADLLDRRTSKKVLYIEQTMHSPPKAFFPVLVLCVFAACGVLLVKNALLALGVILLVWVALALAWQLYERSMLRRMRFARVLVHEISRRKGGDSSHIFPRILLSPDFSSKSVARASRLR